MLRATVVARNAAALYSGGRIRQNQGLMASTFHDTLSGR
jgi:hypothetical protein